MNAPRAMVLLTSLLRSGCAEQRGAPWKATESTRSANAQACSGQDIPHEDGLSLGKVLHREQPKVPTEVSKPHGFACIAVTIDERGIPTEPQIVATDTPEFADAFLASVGHWRFEPTTKDGQAVPFRTVLSASFNRR